MADGRRYRYPSVELTRRTSRCRRNCPAIFIHSRRKPVPAEFAINRLQEHVHGYIVIENNDLRGNGYIPGRAWTKGIVGRTCARVRYKQVCGGDDVRSRADLFFPYRLE